jgi:predicted nucleic acid-binding protein
LPEAAALRSLLHERGIAITGMVLGEVLQGVRSTDPRAELEDLLMSLPFLDEDKDAWHEAGNLSNRLARQGMTTPLSDIIIGIVAMAHGCEVLARDEHFERVPGLKLHTASSRT